MRRGNKERRVGVGGDEEDKERNRVGYYRGGMEEERKTYQLGRQAEAAMSSWCERTQRD